MPTVPAFRVLSSPGFAAWLSQVQASLAFTTYQIGKLFLIGRKSEDQLSVFERTFDRCLGLWTDSQSLWLASAFQLWRLENVLMRDGRTEDGYDRLFVPRASYTTGEIDVHDLAVDEDHNPVFVNTLFSCLATTSQRYSFRSIWHPPFLTRVQPEDACHLNGLAMQAGTARYVTACATTSTPSGWRDCRRNGGVVLDVSTNEIVARGFSMPHSPRLYRDDLWVLNSGTGYFGRVDRKAGTFEPLAFCPGYARGLSFIGNYAVIGLSRPREATFARLELEDGLKAHQQQPQCGLIVLDLSSGRIVEWLSLEGRVEELYDVAVMPGVERPKAIGLKTDEIRHNVWHEEDSFVVRWTANTKRHETDEEKSYEG